MNKKLFSMLTSSLIFLSSCSFNETNMGSFYMSVNFPTKNNFSLKAIPQDTFLILVRVNGEGIDEKKPISFELTREKNSRILSAIPIGNKTVKVAAIDSKGKLLASGEKTVNVESKVLNKAEIELKETSAQIIEQECVVSFPKEEIVSDTLQKALKDAGCKVEVN
jgi:hypothetical protein